MIYVYLRIKVNLLHVCSFALSLSVANLLLLILSCDKTSDCSKVKLNRITAGQIEQQRKSVYQKKTQSSKSSEMVSVLRHHPVSVLTSRNLRFYFVTNSTNTSTKRWKICIRLEKIKAKKFVSPSNIEAILTLTPTWLQFQTAFKESSDSDYRSNLFEPKCIFRIFLTKENTAISGDWFQLNWVIIKIDCNSYWG